MKNEQPAKPAADAEGRTTKAETVVALLQRKEGATLDELTGVTGWQPHTARAVLTGLKKKGHTITRAKEDGTSRWRITGGAPG